MGLEERYNAYKKTRPIHKEKGEDIVYFNVGLFSHFYTHNVVGFAFTLDE